MNIKNKIRIGNQTAFSASSVTLPFKFAIKNKFNTFEWFPDKKELTGGWDTDDLDDETIKFIKDESTKNKVKLTVHLHCGANPLDSETIPSIFKDILFAKKIGAYLVNVHMVNDHGIEKYIESIVPIIENTFNNGIKLSVENTPFTSPDDFNIFFRYLMKMKRIQTKHVGMCLDIGHANLCSAAQNDYVGFIDKLDLSVPISHVHFHENYGDCDSHLTLFTGPSLKDSSGINEVLKRLIGRNYSGSIVLEQWPENLELLINARERLYEMIEGICIEEKPEKKTV